MWSFWFAILLLLLLLLFLLVLVVVVFAILVEVVLVGVINVVILCGFSYFRNHWLRLIGGVAIRQIMFVLVNEFYTRGSMNYTNVRV